MANRPTELTPALHDYLLAHGFREADILKRLRLETQSHDWAIMQITPARSTAVSILVSSPRLRVTGFSMSMGLSCSAASRA